MRNQWFRRLAGLAGLFAMAWLAAGPRLTAADTSAPKAAVEADIAYLQTTLAKTPEKRAVPTIRAAAMNLALAGSGDLREQALKVADAVAKKDYATAKAAAAKLTPGSGGGKAGDPAKLAEQAKYDIGEVMSAFRGSTVGGLNLEKDIRKQGNKADPKAVEVIAGRTALLAEYTKALPSEKGASNAANKKKWEKYSDDMLKISRDLSAESGKGGKDLEKKLKALDASCTACHNEFRD